MTTPRIRHTDGAGYARIVRSRKRAKLLRKRGVILVATYEFVPRRNHVARVWVWYESELSFDQRRTVRHMRALLHRKVREHQAKAGQSWVDSLLSELGPYMNGLEPRDDNFEVDL